MTNLWILIVEERPSDLALIRECLDHELGKSIVIKEADTLESSLALLSHHHFDVVLIDLFLPDSYGVDTLRRVIKKYPDSVLIAITDRDDVELGINCIRYGAQDHLEKKYISPFVLYKSIRYAIERKRNLQEKEELLRDLSSTLKKLASAEGALPLCVSCKRIVGAGNQWVDMEEYLVQLEKAGVENLLCPECKKDHF
jgi:DNA-binding NarL/FixJ family response regulator